MISDGWPAEDATVVRYGLRKLLFSIPVVLVLFAFGASGCALAVSREDIGLAWILVVVLTAMGPVGVILLVSRWRARVTMDPAGVHVSWRGRSTTVARDSPAGVGVHDQGRLRTLELCPKSEIDRDDPLLWLFVRDIEPLRPELPRLRHSVSVRPSDGRNAVAAGCLRWAPDLWFGGQRVAPGFSGNPDIKGHLRRTREAGGRAVTPAP